MAKVQITGRFATTSDVVRVHQISLARQAWLEEQLGKIERSATPARKLSGTMDSRIARKSLRVVMSTDPGLTGRARASKSRVSSKRASAGKSASAKKR